MIKNIQIKEIRGIKFKDFKFNIIPNKPNLFVAPNGFGKSSFATAFNSMKRTGIDLNDIDVYQNDANSQPEITIEMKNGDTYIASSTDNEILKNFSVEVINSQLYPKATTKNFGKFSSSTADICVKSITIINTIPKIAKFEYSFTKMKKQFGTVGKLVLNFNDLLENISFVNRLECRPTF